MAKSQKKRASYVVGIKKVSPKRALTGVLNLDIVNRLSREC